MTDERFSLNELVFIRDCVNEYAAKYGGDASAFIAKLTQMIDANYQGMTNDLRPAAIASGELKPKLMPCVVCGRTNCGCVVM